MKFLTIKATAQILHKTEKHVKQYIYKKIPQDYKADGQIAENYIRENLLPPQNSISIKEASQKIGMSEFTIARNKDLPKRKIMNKYWIDRNDVDVILSRINQRK
jgi:AraC-like DNA-binding protein